MKDKTMTLNIDQRAATTVTLTRGEAVYKRGATYIHDKNLQSLLLSHGYGVESSQESFALPFHLTDEEAFYLATLNTITVYDKEVQSSNLFSLNSLWELFSSKCKRFPISYKVYEYFRAKR